MFEKDKSPAMKCYAVAELNVTNPEWVPRYLQNVTPMVERVGGKFLARTARIDLVEGDRSVPQTIVIIEFPSREAFAEFYNSDAYQPYLKLRQAGSSGSYFLVAGEDMAAKRQ